MEPFKEKINSSESANEEFPNLTEEEMVKIDQALSIIKRGFAMTDDQIKARCDAEQVIISFGHKVLPFLAKQLSGSPHEYFKFTLYADALSQPEDLDFLLRNLGQESVLTRADGSSASTLAKGIIRIIQEIRTQNPQDPRLEEASQALVKMLANPHLNTGSPKGNLLIALSMTGTDIAKQYINDQTDLQARPGQSYYETYLNDPHAAGLYLGRQRFESWEEIQRMRNVNRRKHGIGHDEYPDMETKSDFLNSDYGLGDLESSPEDSLNWDDIPHSVDLNSATTAAIDTTKELISELSGVMEPTSIPAIKLHMFNYFATHPTADEDDIQRELTRMRRLSDMEKEASAETNPLPTIGIEIETFSDRHRISQEILNRLDIPNYDEYDGSLEVNPAFSYSAITQARILQELTKMGVIPLEKPNWEKPARIPENKTLSLHMNFGLPSEIKGDLRFYEYNLYRINDLLTVAFTSPTRIGKRKTSTSISWEKKAAKTKKHKDAPSSGSESDSEQYARLELRATEFRDYPTYRMLVEAQRLVAMLIAYIKTCEITSFSDQEKELSYIYFDFAQEVENYFASIDLTPNLADTDSAKMIRLMKETDLKERARNIISKYSREIATILQNKTL